MKAEVKKFDIAELVNVPTSLKNLKVKVNDLDFDKLTTVTIDLKKSNNVVNKQIVKSTEFSTLKAKVSNLEKKFLKQTL